MSITLFSNELFSVNEAYGWDFGGKIITFCCYLLV